jgi:hypothetical protein
VPFASGNGLSAATANSLVPLLVRKTALETVNNSTTLQNDDEIFWTPATSAVYQLELVVMYNSGTIPDLKLAFTVPTGAALTWAALYVDPSSGSMTVSANLTTGVLAIGGTAGDVHCLVQGVLVMSTTAGNLQLQWAQNTANASNSNVLAGSHGRLVRM